MATTTREHVGNFLGALDGQGAFLRAGTLIAEAAKRDPEVEAAARLIAEWGGPVDAKSLRQAERIRREKPSARAAAAGDQALDTLVAVSYLRAEQAVSQPATLKALEAELRNGRRLHAKVRKTLAGLEPDFLGTLLVEAERRAARDSNFATELDRGKRRLEALAPRLSKIRVAPRERPSPQKAGAKTPSRVPSISIGICSIRRDNKWWENALCAGLIIGFIAIKL